MTKPADSSSSEVPESIVSQLHARYHDAAMAEPSPALDRRILDAARTELRMAETMKSKRTAPWWKSWLTATSAVAVAVLGLSLTWRVMDEQEHNLLEEPRITDATRAPAEEATDKARITAEPVPAPLSIPAPKLATEKSKPVAAISAQPFPADAQTLPEKPVTRVAPQAFPERQATEKMEHSITDERRERSQANAAFEASTRASAPRNTVGINRPGAVDYSSDAARAASPRFPGKVHENRATTDLWIQRIREMVAAGRNAEAAQSLARLRESHPDVVVPDDLLKIK